MAFLVPVIITRWAERTVEEKMNLALHIEAAIVMAAQQEIGEDRLEAGEVITVEYKIRIIRREFPTYSPPNARLSEKILLEILTILLPNVNDMDNV